MSIKNQVQLITYPDSLGGNLPTLHRLLVQHFPDIFKGGIHILPPFPSSGDRGFAPLTYFEIDPKFGNWEDIRRIGERFDIVVDLMVNHISRHSPYFQDFLLKGRRSEYADLFITLDKIWPGGNPPQEDIDRIFLRKPDHPFTTVTIQETQEVERIWTTFGTRDWSEQIDLDVRSEKTHQLVTGYLDFFRRQNIKMVRLDAVGYVIKRPGTSCFMVEPEIYTFLEWISREARGYGLEVLPEVHAPFPVQLKLAAHGYWVYDFILPLLVLHTLFSKSSARLQHYLKICPRRQFTMLDCHDGIPVQPDLDGMLEPEESLKIVDQCVLRGANLNRILSDQHRQHPHFDTHQINCTYYSALDCDDDAYLTARAIQFFAPGIPQVYYGGLLGGKNDQAAVQATGEGRAINRHNFRVEEIEQAVQSLLVQRLLNLIRFRNEYPAFQGEFAVIDTRENELSLAWQKGDAQCRLDVDLENHHPVISYRDVRGKLVKYPV